MIRNFIFLFFITVASSTMAQTKQETIDWLNDKFGNSQMSICTSEEISYARILKINNDGSFVITQYEDWHFHNGVRKKFVSTLSGHFKNLSPSSLNSKILEIKGNAVLCSKKNTFIYLTCTPGITIKQIDYKEDTKPIDGQIVNISSNVNSILIAVIPESGDQSLIDRSKKAFLHLIALCGGKKEVF